MVNLEITLDELLKFLGELYLDARNKEARLAKIEEQANQAERLRIEVDQLREAIESTERQLQSKDEHINELSQEIMRLNNVNEALKQALFKKKPIKETRKR